MSQYKYEYKDNTERESIMSINKALFLIEEQNITEGNFLIFTDVQPEKESEEDIELSIRVSDISTYLSNADGSTISNVEDTILGVESNKVSKENGGM